MTAEPGATEWNVAYPNGDAWEPEAAPELLVFDFDGTLVDQRGGWLVLQELFGIREQGKGLTDRYRAGELTFEEWCLENASLLADRGVRERHIDRAAAAVKFTRGAESLLTTIQRAGVPFGTISGGVANLQRSLDRFDPAFTLGNRLLFDADGRIADVEAAVGPNAKDDVLTRVCADRGLTPADVLYVGDSHTDEEAFDVAGTSVLFDPDSRIADAVHDEVDIVVRTRDLVCVERLITSVLDRLPGKST